MSEQREDLNTAVTNLVAVALACFVLYSAARWAVDGAIFPFVVTLLSAAASLLMSGALKRLGGDKLAGGRFKNIVNVVLQLWVWRLVKFDAAIRILIASGFGLAVALLTTTLSATIYAGVAPPLFQESLSMFTVTLMAWTVINLITQRRQGGFWQGLGEAVKTDLNIAPKPVDEWIAEKTGGNRDRIQKWVHAGVSAFLRALLTTLARAILIIWLPVLAQSSWFLLFAGGAAVLAVAFPLKLRGWVRGARTLHAELRSPEPPDLDDDSISRKDT